MTFTDSEIIGALKGQPNVELVALHNILVMSSKCLMSQEDRALTSHQLTLLCTVLDERAIPHSDGKLIKRRNDND